MAARKLYRLNEEDTRKLLSLSLPSSDVAKVLGVSRQSVDYHRRKLAGPRKKGATRPCTGKLKDRLEELKARWEAGASHWKLAREFGVTPVAIAYHVNRWKAERAEEDPEALHKQLLAEVRQHIEEALDCINAARTLRGAHPLTWESMALLHPEGSGGTGGRHDA